MSRSHTEGRAPDPCEAGLWSVDPAATCPICGALPDTECIVAQEPATSHGAAAMEVARMRQALRRIVAGAPPVETATAALGGAA